MTNEQIHKRKFDLEDRTLKFAKDVRAFVTSLPKTVATIEDGKQVVRSSGSIGANYIEANESLSRKDFGMRIKICRKEAKETRYWLQILDIGKSALIADRDALIQESLELLKIFSA